MSYDDDKNLDFDAIRLKLASPDDVHAWSHGEVTKPETINYRTQRPEKDGLFCERIFGPSKDWECYCGKYKRIRYKGIVCDKCGVEVTRSIVRRERMGHIDLAAPVSHIWFLRGVPSKIGLILGLSVQNLEKIIYFASFIVTAVNEDLRQETLDQVDQERQSKKKSIENSFNQKISVIKQQKSQKLSKVKNDGEKKQIETWADQELVNNANQKEEALKELEEAVDLAKKEIRSLKPLQIISENSYQDLSLKYGHIFEARIGAEAIYKLLKDINLDKMVTELQKEIASSNKNKKKKILRRLRLVTNLKINKIRPEHMILNTIPVIPPDLRPMVQLDGGRFAASDLNDLYRRVINRNNRLKRLLELNAPEVITRNEKRMLQEAVDALIDNGARHGKTVTASTGQKRQLKSLADMLKGKQGRFRQNLLGKRVDYSGRSVIVIGPYLRIDQCGIPKTMALELFKPFVISRLIKDEYVHNVRSATRLIESGRPEIWDILEQITKDAHVLLNRAPTLHRLGIQAFQPVLIEGKAIQIHPLVCAAYNADFDGDQMAVHLPLTEEAKKEASNMMLSANNLLKPATGEPVTTPSQDIVLGCFYMTQVKEVKDVKNYASLEEAIMAYRLGYITIQQKIRVRINNKRVDTNCGRIFINNMLPDFLGFINKELDKKELKNIVSRCLLELGVKKTADVLDQIKKISFEFITTSGISWGMDDLPELKAKKELIKEADQKVEEIQNHYETGLLTAEERHIKIVEIWASLKDRITKLSQNSLDYFGSVFQMVESGSRGSWTQITQMMGMKGLVTNPAGDTIELPVKGSFKEGFDVLEYFISTHGARKGLSDTALRTANAGYLTRRLVDVAQDMVISIEDCGDKEGNVITKKESEEMGETLVKRVTGRVSLEKIVDPKTKKTVVKEGELISEKIAQELAKLDLEQIRIRTVIQCKAQRGLCQKCYGYDLSYNKLVEKGAAVGIIAAQSIGEPGTQLTMRTFHTGGVAGSDITQGLPRVEELFEARPVKKSAVISEVNGRVEAIEEIMNKEGKTKQRLIKIRHTDLNKDSYNLDIKQKPDIKVKDKQEVEKGDVLFETKDQKVIVRNPGQVKIKENVIEVSSAKEQLEEYLVSLRFNCWVKPGDLVNKGDQLTEGSLDLHQLYRLKGREAVEKYIAKEIQYIYSSQGQKLNDKHLEIIVRKMFSRFYIKDAGGTELLSGEIVERAQLVEANIKAKKEGKKEATAENLLLGITKASLSTESFLSASSFQETARVLIDAAITGKVDKLRGLKENVIIGRQIPAGTGFHE